jgi:hypothetical protein
MVQRLSGLNLWYNLMAETWTKPAPVRALEMARLVLLVIYL